MLEKQQIGLALQPAPDRLPVQDTIGLRAGRAHGRALGRVQNAELDAGLVGGERHSAAKGVDFLHQMTLADTADRRIARHLPQGLDAVRQEKCAPAHTRRSERRFGASMAAADDDDVEILGKLHGVAHFTRALFAR